MTGKCTKRVKLTSGYSLTGTKSFSCRCTMGPTASGNSSGCLSTRPFTVSLYMSFLTLVISTGRQKRNGSKTAEWEREGKRHKKKIWNPILPSLTWHSRAFPPNSVAKVATLKSFNKSLFQSCQPQMRLNCCCKNMIKLRMSIPVTTSLHDLSHHHTQRLCFKNS